LSGVLQELASRGERVSCHAKLTADEGIGLPEGGTAQFIKNGTLPGAKGDTAPARETRRGALHHASGPRLGCRELQPTHGAFVLCLRAQPARLQS
jgi:hypothetical protein